MNHDDLIELLSRSLQPVGRRPVSRRVLNGLLIGALVTLLAVGVGLGFRRDLWLALQGSAFWIKLLYTGSLTVCALTATVRLARPDPARTDRLWMTTLPVLALALVGATQMARVPTSEWLAMWLGDSWKVCSLFVFLLSIPIGAGLLWSFRKFAPTRAHLAGAAAGFTAGACAATIYCLHCSEASAIFVLTWYSLGIAIPALAGTLLGPRLLRW